MHTLFDTALFLVCVYFMGFAAAIPVGASQFEVAKRSLKGFLWPALAVVAGSVSSDLVYGSIALFGLGVFLQQPTVEAIFWLVNGLLTLALGIITLRDAYKEKPPVAVGLTTVALVEPSEPVVNEPHNLTRLRNPRIAYLTGFSLAFTNPMMIAWWLLAAQLLRGAHIGPADTFTSRILFLGAGGLGIGSYLTLFAVMVFRAHKSVTNKRSKRINAGFGIAMIALAIYFLVRSVNVFVTL